MRYYLEQSFYGAMNMLGTHANIIRRPKRQFFKCEGLDDIFNVLNVVYRNLHTC